MVTVLRTLLLAMLLIGLPALLLHGSLLSFPLAIPPILLLTLNLPVLHTVLLTSTSNTWRWVANLNRTLPSQTRLLLVS